MKSLANWVLLIGTTAICLAVGECGLRTYYRATYGAQHTAHDLRVANADLIGHLYGPDSACSWPEGLTPHPTLGYVYRTSGHCAFSGVSNINTRGRDLPLTRGAGPYTVLFLGGSVAEQMITNTSENALEKYLNLRYSAPDGRRIVVVNGAIAGWKQPNEMIMLAQAAERIDAFVSLEGYNEATIASMGARLEDAYEVYRGVNRVPGYPWIWFQAISRSRAAVLSADFLRDSYLANVAARGIRALAVRVTENRRGWQEPIAALQYPEDWSSERRISATLDSYAGYLLSMRAIAQAHHVKGAVFVQPIPNLYKKLTAEEIAVGTHRLDPKLYLAMTEKLETLSSKEMPISGLLKIFESETETIYGDYIHCKTDEHGGNRGYDMMASAIADSVAKSWGLRRKSATK